MRLFGGRNKNSEGWKHGWKQRISVYAGEWNYIWIHVETCSVPKSMERGPKSEDTGVCRCTDKLEKQLTTLCYWVIKWQMKSSVMEITHIRKTLNMHIAPWWEAAISQKRDFGVTVGRSLGTSQHSAAGWIESRKLGITWKGKGQSSKRQLFHYVHASPWWVQIWEWHNVCNFGHPISKGIPYNYINNRHK